MGQRIAIGTRADFPEGESSVVTINQKDIAVFNVNGKLFAIDDICMHMGALLSGGFVEDGCVTCPWHYWRFRLEDGTWADNPKVKTGSYPLHIVGDQVELELP